MRLYYNTKFKLLGLITIPTLYFTTTFIKNKIINRINYNKKYREDTLIFKNIDTDHFSFLIKNIKEQTKNNNFTSNIYILCQDEFMVKIPYQNINVGFNNNLYTLKPLLNKYSNIIGYKISTYDNNLDEFILSICSEIL